MVCLVKLSMKSFLTFDQVFLCQIKARLVYTLLGLICTLNTYKCAHINGLIHVSPLILVILPQI